jgi:hypothetical protein
LRFRALLSSFARKPIQFGAGTEPPSRDTIASLHLSYSRFPWLTWPEVRFDNGAVRKPAGLRQHAEHRQRRGSSEGMVVLHPSANPSLTFIHRAEPEAQERRHVAGSAVYGKFLLNDGVNVRVLWTAYCFASPDVLIGEEYLNGNHGYQNS